jgi:hypothetical protein
MRRLDSEFLGEFTGVRRVFNLASAPYTEKSSRELPLERVAGGDGDADLCSDFRELSAGDAWLVASD